ncbi:MAG TPA: hypothetical protein VFX85_04365 [Solirubrobacterales bacterium]|nr:hypothetical protein [Solirubrobacterales bacterium]
MLGALLALAMLLAFTSSANAADQFYLHAGSFSAEGSGDGELSTPARVAIDNGSGDIYVADRGNDRIEVFSPDSAGGGYLTQFGAGLDAPFGIAIDQSSGAVYVTDSGNDRIVKYDSDGAAVPTFTIDAGFTSPALGAAADQIGDFEADIAVDPISGDLLVADPASNLVKRFSASGAHLSNFDGSDSPDGAFTGLLDLDVAPNGDILVLDSQGPVFVHCGGEPDPCPGNNFFDAAPSRVERFSPAGAHVDTVVPLASEGHGLVAVDPNNSQIIVGRVNPQETSNVRVYRADGVRITTFSTKTERTGLTGLAAAGAPGNRLYVVTDKVVQEFNGGVFGGVGIEAYDPVNAPLAEGPPTVSGITPSSAHASATVNPNGEPTIARFEYGRFGSWTPLPAQSIGEGTSPITVEADLTGLSPALEYEVRVTLSNSKGASATSAAASFTTLTEAPYAYSGGAAPRTETTARLNGWVNPRNSPTSYYFEFGTDAGYGTVLPAAPVPVGEGEDQLPASAELDGLQPGTTYHFRLVAENPTGTTYGEDRAFTTRTSAEEGPRQRGIELVNSPDKGNQVAQRPEAGPFADRNATKILWTVTGGAPGASTGAGNTFMAQRTPDGWRSTSLLPASDQLIDKGESRYQPRLASPSFDDFLFEISSGVNARMPRKYGSVDLGLHQEYKGEVSPGNQANMPVRANDDFSRVFTTANTLDGTEQVLEVTADPPEVVSIMADGEPADCGVNMQTSYSEFVGYGGYEWVTTDPAAPTRVYFETKANGSCAGDSQLFMRDVDAGTTTLISGPALPGGPQSENGSFARASADGSRVIFTTDSRLSAEDTNDVGDIYRYQLGVGHTCLTCVGPGAGIGWTNNHDRGVVVSRDLSRVYFEAPNRLVPNVGEPQASNLYEWHDGQIDYVGSSRAQGNGKTSLFTSSNVAMADGGRTIFFIGFDPDVTTDETGETEQVFRYSEVDRSLECVSCMPGVTPKEGVTSNRGGLNAEFALGIDNVAEGGNAVVFQTVDALVPDDVNGDSDVYEWRNGRIGLVTDGVTQYPAGTGTLSLYGIGEDGMNVVFRAGVNLTGYERDGVGQVYVARAGGGFPPPPETPAPCGEESCQGPLQAPPPLSAPGSASIAGAGNATPEGEPRKRKKRCAGKARKGKAKPRQSCGKNRAQKKSQKGSAKKKSANRKQGGNR